MTLKFISWNIDSINAALEQKSPRAKLTYSILESIAQRQPDFIAIQEPKLKPDGLTAKQEDHLEMLFPNYLRFVNPATSRSGYAGTILLSKHNPLNFEKPTIDSPDTMDQEGRITTLEFDNFYLSTVYTPNSGSNLARLSDRGIWDDQFRKYLNDLSKKKPVIISGDFNVAHTEIDLKNPNTNHQSAGFTDQEREKFTELLDAGFIDTWRYLHPNVTDVYSWWAQISRTAKQNNSGWRIDYYLVSDGIKNKIINAGMLDTGERADHAPIFLELEDF